MVKDRVVLCAGCLNRFESMKTVMYRKKRCCTDAECYKIIDKKVATSNYKKQQRKIAKGKYRNGVPIELKGIIHERDDYTCQNCRVRVEQYKMQVHHIKPVSEGGDDDLSNLILLCKTCHSEVHKEGYENYYDRFTDYTKSLGKIQ